MWPLLTVVHEKVYLWLQGVDSLLFMIPKSCFDTKYNSCLLKISSTFWESQETILKVKTGFVFVVKPSFTSHMFEGFNLGAEMISVPYQ